jgi:methionyl aminopeptidase
MSVDSPEQLRGLRSVGQVVAETLHVLRGAVTPGVTTAELDRLAAETFARHGARSGPILTYGYPGSVCVSLDEEVVHGVPGERVARAGELISLDVAAELDGYHADAAVVRTARRRGFRVLRELTGHGIGYAMHEEPTVPNWAAPEARTRLTPGLVFTIEPMLTAGRPRIVLEGDGWTIRTADRAPSAHEEHTIMVSRGGPVILTAA